MKTAFQVAELAAPQAVAALRAGLPCTEFDRVAKALRVSAEFLAESLGASLRTIRHQQKKSGRLSLENSERVVRVARLLNLARRLFAEEAAVAEWFARPAPALGGRTPYELLDTETGAREIEDTLQGLAYGNVL